MTGTDRVFCRVAPGELPAWLVHADADRTVGHLHVPVLGGCPMFHGMVAFAG